MKIAIASEDGRRVSGHAGQARRWLVYQTGHDGPPGAPRRVELARDEVYHRFRGGKPHPLDGVSVIVSSSAGEGFVRRMRKRGVEVVLTGQEDAAGAAAGVLAGKPLPPRRHDLAQYLCKLRDLFSKH